jgi:DNA primase
LAEEFNLKEAEGRAACLKEALPLVDQIPQSAIRTQIENELARLVRFTADEFKGALQRYQQEKEASTRVFAIPQSSSYAEVPTQKREVALGGRPSAALSRSVPSQGGSYHQLPLNRRRAGAEAIRQPMPLARQLLSLLANHPAILDKIGERQLEILRRHPHMDVVVEFIAFAFSSGARHIGSLIQHAEQGSQLHQLLLSLAKDSSTIESLPNPEAEWNDAIKKIELEILDAELKRLSSMNLETDEERRRYLAVLARFNFLKS